MSTTTTQPVEPRTCTNDASSTGPRRLLDRTIGELVAERPGRARVFENLGMDYCCGGRRPLRQACRDQKVDPFEAVLQLEREDERLGSRLLDEPDWTRAPLAELADHIEQTHHVYLRRELPRLDRLTEKVVSAHGTQRPEMIALRDAFLALRDELEPHMIKEEQVYFPFCRALERAAAERRQQSRFSSGTSGAGSAQVLIHEHDAAGNLLARIRELADDFVPPADACNTYRAMLDGLAALETDMHQHVHKENNILFPRALALEAAMMERN